MPTTLIVTNDFPPRIGGIERFVEQVCDFCDGDVAVLTSREPGSAVADARRAYEVVRAGTVLLPTPSVARQAAGLLRRSGATRVVFGAAAPLGLLAGGLRRAGARRIVALSHGHETWWAQVPGGRTLLRRIAAEVDALTTISDYTAGRIAPVLSAGDRAKLSPLPPPVDTDYFVPRPAAGPAAPRRCVAVGRLVRRKGVDTLIRAWPDVRRRVPGAELVVVGDGPERRRLTDLASRLAPGAVTFTGGLDRAGVREQLWGADVFALPMRVRLGGLDAEGLGLAALEAAACGLPAVVGDSGGAPETVRDGESGFVVPPEDPPRLTERLVTLLGDGALARTMGVCGRAYVVAGFGAAAGRDRLRRLLELD
ncbi:glycosyltransferase family 4 protein [Microlunatus ginsengisoli]|uniref:Glycosyltransferase family 4 protein n=1 Tax=Microlunatus ginsengisoli TaxID=363863 RepID=A0ABP6ZVJ1_9ACTN